MILKQHQRPGEEISASPPQGKQGDHQTHGLRALPAWLDSFLEKASKERQKVPKVPPRNAFAQQFAALQHDRERSSSSTDASSSSARASSSSSSSTFRDRPSPDGSTTGSGGGINNFFVVEVPVPKDQVRVG